LYQQAINLIKNKTLDRSAIVMFLLLAFVGVLSSTLLLYVAVKLWYRPRAAKHPVFIGPDMWTNIALLTATTTCTGATHYHNLNSALTGFGKTAFGAVFQLYMLSSHFVVVTDYKLARLVMVGDNSQGIKESEKTTIGLAFDLISKCGSIFSSLTSDPQRHKARKFLAPCFSFSNLKYTFKVILKSLITCQHKLTRYAKAGTTFELNDVMIRLTFDVITESSFGVNWNTQSDDVVSDGTVFLHESDVRLREGARRTFNPLRKYCFWTKDYKRREVAVERILSILRGVVSQYRTAAAASTNANSNGAAAATVDQSIMGHLMRHEYADDDRRITDMNTFLIAGE
jgi:cytochrome P450